MDIINAINHMNETKSDISSVVTDEDRIRLVKRLNYKDGVIAACQVMLNVCKTKQMSEEQVLADFGTFIERAFLAKNLPLAEVKEHTSVILSMLRKELVLQKAFLALE